MIDSGSPTNHTNEGKNFESPYKCATIQQPTVSCVLSILYFGPSSTNEILFLSPAHIGTQTAGGRTVGGPMMRGVSQYKYSSGVRNVQQVITVPAPVPQQVIYIYASINM